MKKLLLCLLLVGCQTQYTFRMPEGTPDTPEARKQAYRDDFECRQAATYQPPDTTVVTQSVGGGNSKLTEGFTAGVLAARSRRFDEGLYMSCMRSRGYEPY
jgi:hypothetical protein